MRDVAIVCAVEKSRVFLILRRSRIDKKQDCPERHVAMCADRGIDLAGHRSTVVQPSDLAWADLVVLMDRHNWQALQLIGARNDRVVWLGVLDGGPIEIPDPYTLDDESARRVLARLQDCTSRLKDRLVGPAVDDAVG